VATGQSERDVVRVAAGALSIKCLFGLALRQSLGMVESLLSLAGLVWKVPDFSTVCRR